MNTRNLYTDNDLAIIRQHYPAGGTRAVQHFIKRSEHSIRHKAKELGVTTTCRLNKLDLSHLMDVRSERAAYVLGLIWGDGTLNKRSYHLSVTMNADDFAEVAHLFDGWCFRAICPKQRTWRVSYQASLSHKVFHSFLSGMGYLDKSKGSPDLIIAHIPEVYRHGFFRGWFDADGHNNSLMRVQDNVCIAGSWAQDWSALRTLVAKLGIHGRVEQQKNKRGRGSVFRIHGKQSVLRFFKHIYSGERFGLSRKRANYDRYLVRVADRIRLLLKHPKNVYLFKPGRYSASITVGGVNRWLGYHPTIEEAALVHDKAAWKVYGDELMLNKPDRFNSRIYDELGLTI